MEESLSRYEQGEEDQKASLLEIQIALRESHPATSGQATHCNTASNEQVSRACGPAMKVCHLKSLSVLSNSLSSGTVQGTEVMFIKPVLFAVVTTVHSHYSQ